MGGRKHGSKDQGIRKKKKNSKQTLAKVAERKEQQDANLRAKIHRTELHNNALRHGIHAISASTVHKDFFVNNLEKKRIEARIFEDEKRTKEQQIQQSKAQHMQKAYRSLIQSLSVPVTSEEKLKNNEESTNIDMKEEKDHPQETVQSEQTKFSSWLYQDIESSVLEFENRTAAKREQQHFATDVKPQNITNKMLPIGVYQNIGKISTNLQDEKQNEMVEMLGTNVSKIGVHSLGLQPSLYMKWEQMRTSINKQSLHSHERFGTFIECLRTYRDILVCQNVNHDEEDLFRQLYTMHLLAHVLRCRARVLRNDAARRQISEQSSSSDKDQGFNRARVLVLVPMRNVAYDIVKCITSLVVGTKLEGKDEVQQVANSERFKSEFAPEDEDEEDETNEIEEAMSDDDDLGAILHKSKRKPKDYRRIFRGNIDDDFKIGISFSRKSVKLYADFYDSDIIIASPLGLQKSVAEKEAGTDAFSKMVAAKKKEEEETEWKTGLVDSYERKSAHGSDDGFLSSIEMCVVDGAHIFSMQNWDVLRKTVAMINKMPESTRDTDFSRVKDWCLDGLMGRFRQTIVLSKYRSANTLSLVRGLSNHDGIVQLLDSPTESCSMNNVVVSMRQTFFKIPHVTDPIQALDRRFEYFCSRFFPMLRALTDSQCLMIIPSYFDYVRVRNALVKFNEEDPTFQFASMCEYSKGSDISRARSKLFNRSVSMVIMTERFHFYWRHWIRGVNTIAWYGLPENCEYYPEISNMTAEAAEVGRLVQSFALYDRFDSFSLERIVGNQRCKKMIASSSKSTYLFST